jgi:hypothetical protein
MAIKKKVAPKKSVKKITKKRVTTPCVVHKSNSKGKTYKSKPSSLDEIKEMISEKPPLTHQTVSTSFSGYNVLQEIKKDKATAYDIINQIDKDKNIFNYAQAKSIVVTVRNNSNFTLRDVKLFDNNFKSQQDVHYSTAVESVNYEDLLRRKNSNGDATKFFGQIHIKSSTLHQPFQTLYVTNTEIDGAQISIPHTPILDPNQNQSGIATMQTKIPFWVGSNIIISSLAPDTKVTFIIWFLKS